MTYISKDDTSVKYAEAESEKNIPSKAACSCLGILQTNNFQTMISFLLISFLMFFLIIYFLFLLFFSVWRNIRHFQRFWNLCHKHGSFYNWSEIGRWHLLLSKQSFDNDAQNTACWIKQTSKKGTNEAQWDTSHSIVGYSWQGIKCLSLI